MLKNIRDKDNEKHKKWSKDHGSDTYGKTELKRKQEKKEHYLEVNSQSIMKKARKVFLKSDSVLSVVLVNYNYI